LNNKEFIFINNKGILLIFLRILAKVKIIKFCLKAKKMKKEFEIVQI